MIRKLFYQPIGKSLSHVGIFIFFFFMLISAKAQVPSTEGVDFWLTFLYNHSTSSTTNLIISAQRACTGTISNPNTGWSTTFSVPAQGRTEVSIPNAQGYCTGNGSVENKGIWVTSTDTISLYAANYIAYTFDATNVLPTPALGNEYLIQTYSGVFDGSNVAFVATQNNTILDITPSTTAGGHAAGTPFSVTLNRGQAYQMITSSSTGDLSGTRVVARDCKTFAVFAGCRCTQVPYGYGYCDHIVEQTWPTTSWGKEFVVTNSMSRTRDRVRVTASDNNTQVYRDGSLLTTLNSGGMYEFEVTSSQPAVYINATNPISIYLYFTGSTYGGPGDPSMVWISPVEQRIGKITFGTFSPGQTLTQYINIISPTLSVPSMTLDGSNISAQFTTVPGNINYSYARRTITHGTHTLEGDSGFVAHVYGLGQDESYSFSVGSSAANLKNKLYVNGVASVDISSNQEYCMNDTIIFRSYVETDYDAILWEFGDGSTGTGDTASHVFPTYGYYTVNMIIDRRSSNNNCGGYDTISTFVRILENESSIYDTICAGFHYTENGLDLIGVQDTSVTNIYPSFWGCDSIVNVHLHVFPIDPIPVTASICMGETYNENGFNIYADRVGLITDTLYLLSSFGCDSTVILYLNVSPLPSVFLGNDRILCSESQFPLVLDAGSGMVSYEWSTGATSQTISVMQEGTYSVTISTGENCTATDEITLELHNVTVTISQDPEDFCANSMAILTANTEATSIMWNTGETTPSIIVTQYGSYLVTVSDGYCEATDRIGISECPAYIFIPNTITPYLNDGINDYFEIMGDTRNIRELEIFIYDRWGQLVFESKEVHFKWDGKVNGVWIPNHVFSYALRITTLLGKKEVYKGVINVL